MKRKVGLWIDHRKAVIVSLRDNEEEMCEISSHMQKHVRFSGGANEASAEDQRDRRFSGHLQKYNDEVASCIRDADSILILGPGEAKIELKTRLENEALGERIAAIETVDKMTDGQLAGKSPTTFLTIALVDLTCLSWRFHAIQIERYFSFGQKTGGMRRGNACARTRPEPATAG